MDVFMIDEIEQLSTQKIDTMAIILRNIQETNILFWGTTYLVCLMFVHVYNYLLQLGLI